MAGPGRITDVSRSHDKVVSVALDLPTVEDEQHVLCMSDLHFDNAHCDRRLLRKHLDWAVENDAAVILLGDTFCAMQGKYDKRSDRSQLRAEYVHGPYFDKLVNHFLHFIEPYAKNIIMVSPGNHEGSVWDRHETDLTGRTVDGLNAMGSPCKLGTMQGWLWWRALTNTTKRYSHRWAYHHGYGGGGPVTLDSIQFNRQRAYLDGCDAVLSGHTHDAWCIPVARVYCDRHGIERRRIVWGLKTGTYKDEFECGSGWAVGKGMPPKPKGCVRLKLKASNEGLYIEDATPMLR